MGMLKDLRKVSAMGREIQRTTDVSARLADAQAAMAAANATMAAMTARATSTVPVTGTPGTATVVAAVQTGQFVNFAPVVRLDLLVQVPGSEAEPVTITEIVDQLHLARVRPGAALPVKVGAAAELWIDWSRA